MWVCQPNQKAQLYHPRVGKQSCKKRKTQKAPMLKWLGRKTARHSSHAGVAGSREGRKLPHMLAAPRSGVAKICNNVALQAVKLRVLRIHAIQSNVQAKQCCCLNAAWLTDRKKTFSWMENWLFWGTRSAPTWHFPQHQTRSAFLRQAHTAACRKKISAPSFHGFARFCATTHTLGSRGKGEEAQHGIVQDVKPPIQSMLASSSDFIIFT